MTYEMLTGRLPFTEGSQAALLMKQVTEPVPDVREVDPLIPESVALWVQRMCEKDPDDRFPDASAAWEAFEEALLEHVGPLWRRDAVLKPASEIELDDIPPQTATPLRPTSRSGAGSGAGLDERDRISDLPRAGGAARAARRRGQRGRRAGRRDPAAARRRAGAAALDAGAPARGGRHGGRARRAVAPDGGRRRARARRARAPG